MEILGPDGEPVRRKEAMQQALDKTKQQPPNPSRTAINNLQRKLNKKRIPYVLFYILDGKTHLTTAIIPPEGTTKKQFLHAIIDNEIED